MAKRVKDVVGGHKGGTKIGSYVGISPSEAIERAKSSAGFKSGGAGLQNADNYHFHVRTSKRSNSTPYSPGKEEHHVYFRNKKGVK